MSIILAIEPDRRRAAQLTGMARMHLKAELLVAANASEAVDALAGRVPDVLLTAPLLPSQEETAIGDYLRQLGTAAAHVQTLTIPLLASGAGDRDRPVLSAFRRGRTQRTEAEGCDPAVFAEQISGCLRAARERRATPSLVAVGARTVDAPQPFVDVAPPFAEDSSEPVPFSRSLTTRETVSQLLARLFPADDDATPNEPGPAIPSFEPAFALSPDVHAKDVADDLIASPAHELAPLSLPIPRATEPVTFPASFELSEPISLTVDAPPIAEPVVIAAPSQAHPCETEVAQDEWRFFDPSQCGFPALIAKLDEIAARHGEN
jgi:hypothetical protein